MNKTNLDLKKDSSSENIFSLCCGLVIRKIRKENGISACELAKKVNISQQQMSRYERGINKFSIDMLFDITVALNIPFERLIKYVVSEVQKLPSDSAAILKNKILASDMIYFY
ncbi:helix-turn-helix domain-containing protein [Providencia alcalifaciens]|uniref:helix-turn-helix domain-containing protein n=1 Tax=Providencia alcalifaciens TaxID=126385 RepID=UPI001CC5C62D|nr:helix-turn-helix transcriptional regulator [Providencia alcalifaciens]CAG9406696.1 hypothetical protein NVI2019_GHJFPKLH_00126 [Providencia alcalifaciens]